MTFPRVRLLSGRSVENREARERGQGAARDSPRCLNAPGMKTKKAEDAQCPKDPNAFAFFLGICAAFR